MTVLTFLVQNNQLLWNLQIIWFMYKKIKKKEPECVKTVYEKLPKIPVWLKRYILGYSHRSLTGTLTDPYTFA
jgi:hypothetical protein